MTELPDDMEAVRMRLGLLARDLERDNPWQGTRSAEDAADLRALLKAYQERGRALEALMDAEFARDWRTWSDERARLLLGVGPRYDAFMTARTTLSQKGDER
jgi:hypothetical protein